jgi:hypothetical protein
MWCVEIFRFYIYIIVFLYVLWILTFQPENIEFECRVESSTKISIQFTISLLILKFAWMSSWYHASGFFNIKFGIAWKFNRISSSVSRVNFREQKSLTFLFLSHLEFSHLESVRFSDSLIYAFKIFVYLKKL